MFLSWHLHVYLYIGINADARIESSPSGDPVTGSSNTFVYPILSTVTLSCITNPPPPQSFGVTYMWNTLQCYTNYNYDNWAPENCFPYGRTTSAVIIEDARAEHAVTITCTVTYDGMSVTSDPFTLHISGAVCVSIFKTCFKLCVYHSLDIHICRCVRNKSIFVNS